MTRGVTGRQLEILRLSAEGLNNAAIARRLGISGATVRAHFADAYARLGARSKADAWRALGWLSPTSR